MKWNERVSIARAQVRVHTWESEESESKETAKIALLFMDIEAWLLVQFLFSYTFAMSAKSREILDTFERLVSCHTILSLCLLVFRLCVDRVHIENVWKHLTKSLIKNGLKDFFKNSYFHHLLVVWCQWMKKRFAPLTRCLCLHLGRSIHFFFNSCVGSKKYYERFLLKQTSYHEK